MRLHEATLHVVSVLPDFGMPLVGSYFRKDYEKDALLAYATALRDWVGTHVPDDVNVRPHVLHGSIYDEILRAADKLDADLIVIGSHRPELKDYLLGPNAARVVRHGRQSVYVVRD
ncbi:universal stress protein [Roseicitreum antarcticum]|uniref:Nucleotide-binding universal stress protein, UspA family n=1 Tax=Roseicitreum antarcticum TaxID=564137 RepID=A0A1H3E2S9_9RHOB|nr:Nucleotide-binding universal stress protein, UspA family [Roseicitreum antarcticum]